MDVYIGVIIIDLRRNPARQEPVRVDTVNYIHLMSTSRQFIGQSMDKDAIPPKIVRGIKGRDHAKAEWSIFHPDLHCKARRTRRGTLHPHTYHGKNLVSMILNKRSVLK